MLMDGHTRIPPLNTWYEEKIKAGGDFKHTFGV
jgi:hypothetical protein